MENNLNLETLKFPIGKFIKPEIISNNDVLTWIEIIDLFPEKLKKATINLSKQELNYKYRPDGWSIKQVVHHCADSHMNSFMRFKLALTEQNPIIKPYNEAAWAKLNDGNSYDIFPSLQIIEGLHKRWVLLLLNLKKEKLTRQFTNPESHKTYTLEQAIGLYAWHCNHHLAHVKQALEHEGKFNL
jgi:DinB superfamily